MKIEKKPLNLYLSTELIQETKITCIKNGLTVSELIESLLEEYLLTQNGNMQRMEEPKK